MKALFCVVAVCGVNAGIIPNGLSEPLTKMAEQMALVPDRGGRAVAEQLQASAKASFAASEEAPLTLHVEEPQRGSAESFAFQQYVQEISKLQNRQFAALSQLKGGKFSGIQKASDAEFNIQYEFSPLERSSFVQDDVLDVFRKVAGGAHGDSSKINEFVEQQIAKVHEIKSRLARDQAAFQATLKSSGGNAQRASNACNYARMGSEFAYQQVNRIVNGLGHVVSKMCGCVMVGGQTQCALADVPEICGFPYQAYSALYAGSQSLWEAVKATTLQCRVIGDPAVASR